MIWLLSIQLSDQRPSDTWGEGGLPQQGRSHNTATAHTAPPASPASDPATEFAPNFAVVIKGKNTLCLVQLVFKVTKKMCTTSDGLTFEDST